MAERRLGRYLLGERVASTTAGALADGTALWRGLDTVLEREVAIRVVDADDARVPAFLAAARAAAMTEDRRLLRVLDVLELADLDGQRVSAVVSEWAPGPTLAVLARDGGLPLRSDAAGACAADIARAVAAGLASDLPHGRLRPSSVIIDAAGEVRVRGMAVDAALFGPLGATDPSLGAGRAGMAADVDGTGSLLYLLATGTWPGEPAGDVPLAPRGRDRVLPPSHVRADVPRAIDDITARSVRSIDRPRGMAELPDVAALSQALGIARDHVTPVAHAAPLAGRSRGTTAGRLAVAGVGVVIALVIGVVGWQFAAGAAAPWVTGSNVEGRTDEILTAPTQPVPEAPLTGVDRVLPIDAVRSFDPFGDDDSNGKPDRRRGIENEEAAPNAIDGDETTAWTSETYGSADASGKGGVGIILDLGGEQPVRAVDLRFTEAGSAVEVRIADEILRDPALWSLLAKAPAGEPAITLRAPRPLTGRYVLLWFPELPLIPGRSSTYEVSLAEARVLG